MGQSLGQLPLLPLPIIVATEHAEEFTPAFLAYLVDNLHIYDAFEREAMRVVHRGFSHYSSRTIIEFLRHHSALQEIGSAWKINDHITPYMARLFVLVNPAHRDLFEFRVTKTGRRTPQAAGACA